MTAVRVGPVSAASVLTRVKRSSSNRMVVRICPDVATCIEMSEPPSEKVVVQAEAPRRVVRDAGEEGMDAR